MTTGGSNQPKERLLQLVERTLDGNISSAEFEELTLLLGKGPRALVSYVEYVNLQSSLRQTYLSVASLPEAPEETAEFSDEWLSKELMLVRAQQEAATLKSQWPKYFLSALAVSVLLAIGLLGQMVLSTAPEKSALERGIATSLPEKDKDKEGNLIERVAVVTRLHDVQWEDGVVGGHLNQPLSRQRLNIKSGLMQIEFYCGAAVILEGPASIELLAPDRGFAHYGKLRAYVPARAKGFSIETDAGNFVDLGTEFGLQVSPEGRSELHVIDGEVEFHDSVDSDALPRLLVGGQAIEVASNGAETRLIDSDGSRFMSSDGLEIRANEKSLKKYQEWVEYHARLREDPTLVADYVFDNSAGWGRTLVNAAPGAEESFGAIVGASWQRGRWAQSSALRFMSPSDRVRIKLDGQFDSLSLGTWVRIREFEGLHDVAILHPDVDYGRDPSLQKQKFIHWTLDRNPDGALLHFAESQGHERENRNHYSSTKHGIYSSDLGQWVHLAVVYDRDARKVAHYKDAELVGEATIENPRKLEIGIANIGNWPYRGWAAGTHFEFQNLQGDMDEFVILSRALSAAEIGEMVEAGRP